MAGLNPDTFVKGFSGEEFDEWVAESNNSNLVSDLVINVKGKPYLARGDGTHDDTAAIQAAMDACAAENATLYFPVGTYKVTDTLTYTGSSGSGILMLGEGNGPRGGGTGAALVWSGVDGGMVIHLLGANNTRIQSLAISPAGGCKYFGGIYLQENDSMGGAGSSGCTIQDVTVEGGYGAGSYAIRLGNNTHQVSEVDIRRVSISGVDSIGTSAYGIVTDTGNTKNFNFQSCAITHCGIGMVLGGSGYNRISACGFGESTIADIQVSVGTVEIGSVNSEGSARFVTGTGGASAFGLSVKNSNWTGPATDNKVISVNYPNLFLEGNFFWNNDGNGIAQIEVASGGLDSAGTGYASVSSFGNTYVGAVDYLPLMLNNGFAAVPGLDGSATVGQRLAVISLGDKGGDAGTRTPLQAVFGSSPLVTELLPEAPQFGVNGITYRAGTPTRAAHKVTVSYTAFKAAAPAQAIQVFTVPAKTNLLGVICDSTQAFAGLSSTIRLSVSSDGGTTDDLLLSHDVKSSAVTKGILEDDLGDLLVRTALVQGAYMPWTALPVFLLLSSGSGNIGTGSATNLNAGSVTLYLVTERIG